VCRTLLRSDKKARTSARASIGLVKTSGWSCGNHSRSLRTSNLEPEANSTGVSTHVSATHAVVVSGMATRHLEFSSGIELLDGVFSC
jgi:hypothetical protein